MPLSPDPRDHSAQIVGQDGILRAGLATGACWPVYKGFRRVTNPPQVANLPHKFCRIPFFGLIEWHRTIVPPHTNTGSGCSTSAPAAAAKATSGSAVFSGAGAAAGVSATAASAGEAVSTAAAALARLARRGLVTGGTAGR